LEEATDLMDNTTLSAVLWIAAGAMLALYLLRRRKRKMGGR
jgi:LPXTG-motif cell wall-anchored protein